MRQEGGAMLAAQEELLCKKCRKPTLHTRVDRRKRRLLARLFPLGFALTIGAIILGLILLRDLFIPEFYERTSRWIHYLFAGVSGAIAGAGAQLLLRLLLGKRRWALAFARAKRAAWQCEVCQRVRGET